MENERDYHLRRASAERAIAQGGSAPNAAIHLKLAELHEAEAKFRNRDEGRRMDGGRSAMKSGSALAEEPAMMTVG